MIKLGKKSEVGGVELLRRLNHYDVPRDTKLYGDDRPSAMPQLAKGERLIAGYDQGFGEVLGVIEDLEDAQQVYAAYRSGLAISLNWYAGPDPGFVVVMRGEGDGGPLRLHRVFRYQGGLRRYLPELFTAEEATARQQELMGEETGGAMWVVAEPGSQEETLFRIGCVDGSGQRVLLDHLRPEKQARAEVEAATAEPGGAHARRMLEEPRGEEVPAPADSLSWFCEPAELPPGPAADRLPGPTAEGGAS